MRKHTSEWKHLTSGGKKNQHLKLENQLDKFQPSIATT